jgi:hypothetical protein
MILKDAKNSRTIDGFIAFHTVRVPLGILTRVHPILRSHLLPATRLLPHLSGQIQNAGTHPSNMLGASDVMTLAW